MKITENTFQKGNIYLTEFPFTDIARSKIRPVVVLFPEGRFDDVIVMAISSVLGRKDEPGTVHISPEHTDFVETGLKEESVILSRRISTVKKSRLFYRLGSLSQRYIDEIDMVLINKLKIGFEIDKEEDYIPYGRQSVDDKDIFSVVKTLRSEWLTQGPSIRRFEQVVADYCSVKYAVVVNSATSALHLACLASGLGKGDILWTSPNTFVASANCGLYCGASVDFVDIESRSYNMSVNELAIKLEKAKKAGNLPKIVIPVHFAGQSCEMDRISKLANQYGFSVIEDASHAIGGSYKGSQIGSCTFSDMTVFSFHPVKIITTGEGGIVLTNRKDLYERLVRLRTHGITRDPGFMEGDTHGPWYYQQIELGFNYRMTDIQAALGASQMSRLDDFVACRNYMAKRYNELLKDLPVTLPWQHPDSYSAYHLYVIRLRLAEINKTHRQVFEEIRSSGIGINLHYIPVHTQPYYKSLGFKSGEFPEAEKYYSEAISLPNFYDLSEEEQDFIIEILRKVLM